MRSHRLSFKFRSTDFATDELHDLELNQLWYICKSVNRCVFDGIMQLTLHRPFSEVQSEIDQSIHFMVNNLRLLPFSTENPHIQDVRVALYRQGQNPPVIIANLDEATRRREIHPAESINILADLIRDAIWIYDFKLVNTWPHPARYALERRALWRIDNIVRRLAHQVRWKLAQTYGQPPLYGQHNLLWLEWNST